MQVQSTADQHEQLRSLYRSLLEDQDRFDEFKEILSRYPDVQNDTAEPPTALNVRQQLNGRIRAWVGAPFEGLSAQQVVLWRAIVVDQRFNVALSPWKEANFY